MKKNFRRAMAAVMAAALTLSLAGTAAEADAAKKKKIKLASKTVTVKAKKSKTVKIKNVKAKQVKKLTVKSASKKIATAKAKGKTAVKVTGKKAGKSTKVKITLKLKGQKKATKLTLKVKVAKAKPVPPAVTNAPAPATQAPNVPSTKAPDAPAASQPPQGGEASQAPATGKPSAKPQPSKAPAVVPTWTPDPKKEVSEITLHYTKDETRSFEVTNEEGTKSYAPKMIKFTDADDYPEGDAIDVRYYKKVIVKYEGKKFEKDGGWDNGGKATLNTTNEDLGQSAYTNGLFMKYLHDLTTAEVNAYKDGVYTVEYDISEATLDPEGGWEFPDVGEIDCVSVQMGNEENYEGFKLQTIEFKEPIQTGTTTPTADPNATADPDKTADPNATADPDKTTAPTVAPTATPKVTAKFANGQDTVQIEEEGETTITVTTDKGTVKTVRFAAVTADVADVDNTNPAAIKVTGKNAGTTEIKGSVTLTIDGKDVVIDNVSAGTLTVVPKGTPIVEAEVESAEIEMIAGTTGTAKVKNVTVKVSGETVTPDKLTYVWTIDDNTVAGISGTTAEATVTAKERGTATATVTITANHGGKDSAPLPKKVTVKVYDKLTVDTAAIEYAANDVAINGTVAPKALLGNTVKTNGTIAEVVEWAIVETAGVEKAETETASIDAKTGVVTGKKAGTVKVKATVEVTGPLDQKETVVVEGTVTVNNNRMLSLKKDNVTREGSLYAADFSGEPHAGKPVENPDGSITWYTNTTWGGGGLNFYLNSDKSEFDLAQYSKIKITCSVAQSEADAKQVYVGLVCDGKKVPSWGGDPVNVALDGKPNAYPILKGNGQEDVIEIDLTQDYTIPQDTDKRGDCGVYFVRVKYNADGKAEGTKSTITVKSIELIAKTDQ